MRLAPRPPRGTPRERHARALAWCGAVLVASLAPASLAAQIAPAERRSAYEDLSPTTRAMQDDDTANPAMLSVLDGEALWSRRRAPRTLLRRLPW